MAKTITPKASAKSKSKKKIIARKAAKATIEPTPVPRPVVKKTNTVKKETSKVVATSPIAEEIFAPEIPAKKPRAVVKKKTPTKKSLPTLDEYTVDQFVEKEMVGIDLPVATKRRAPIGIGVLALVVMTVAGLTALGMSQAFTKPEAAEAPILQEANAEAQSTDTNNTPITLAPLPGIYTVLGEVKVGKNGNLSVTTVSPIGDTSTVKKYSISTDSQTGFFHQIAMKKEEGLLSYEVERGDAEDIQTGYFVSVTTNDDTVNSTTLKAITVNYSETNPFGE